jgi:hypothetical protein
MKLETRSPRHASRGYRQTLWLRLVLILLACGAPPVGAESGRTIAHNTPNYVSSATNLRPEEPSRIMEVSIWLNLHDRAGLDALVQDLIQSRFL